VFDTTAITGAFLGSDNAALTINVFVTDFFSNKIAETTHTSPIHPDPQKYFWRQSPQGLFRRRFNK